MTVLAMLISPALFAADLQVTPPACISAAQNPRVVASVPSAVNSARVYFKAHGEANEYYVYMHKTASGWAGMLPIPLASTSAVDYRVVSADGNGAQTSSSVFSTTVAASCPAQALTADDQANASNLVLGLTGAKQSAVPPGFQCKGIVSYIAINGDMKPNDECRRLVAAAAASGSAAGVPAGGATAGAATTAGTTASSGLSARTITALSIAGAAALGIGIYENNKSTTKTSPSKP